MLGQPRGEQARLAGAAVPTTAAATAAAESAEALLQRGEFHLVYCIRFLERALLPRLVALLALGGFVLVSTWVDGPGLRAFGRPACADRVLAPGELAARYFGPDQGFRVVLDEVKAADDGREMSWFVAQRVMAV